MRATEWLCVGILSLAGCGAARDVPPRPTPIGEPLAAFERICVRPGSHRAVVAAARALNWTRLDAGKAPDELVGAARIGWTEILVAPSRGGRTVLAVGHLGGTSYCRLAFSETPRAPAQAVAEMNVLGAALGAPDFRPPSGAGAAEQVVGWHRGGARDWRAVHVTRTEAATPGARYLLEVTRPLA